MEIRRARDGDLDEVLRVEREAFGMDKEAELVRALLLDPTAQPLLSLLAFDERGRAVGHLLFTNAVLDDETQEPSVPARLLAPLAVVPAAQKTGVGGALVRDGLARLKDDGVALVFVLGHPTYYPLHGFEPAGRLGFVAPFPIPEKDADAWMVQALRPGLLGTVRGAVAPAEELLRPEHWRE